MTVETALRSAVYVGNGVTTVWSLPALVLDETHVEVILFEIATQVETVIASSLFSVVGIGNPLGIDVTYPLSGSPVASTHNVVIRRTVPFTQETDIINQGGFLPEVVENQLDLIVMQTQQNSDKAIMPVIAVPGELAVFNAAGDGLANGGDAGDIAGASANAAAAAASAAAALISEGNAAADSQAPAFTWNFDTATADADPSSGEIRLDNASFASVTTIFISESAQEGDVSGELDAWDDNASAIRARLRIIDPTAPTNWALYNITAAQVDGGAYRKFTVTHVDSSGSLWAAATLLVVNWYAVSSAGGASSSTTQVLAGVDTITHVTPNAQAAYWEKGGDITSAATISVGEGGTHDVTGTVGITDIDFTTDKAGRTVRLVFEDVLVITHSSTLIMPGGEDYTTKAGDVLEFQSDGAADTVRCTNIQRNATGYVEATGTNYTGSNVYDFPHGNSVQPSIFGTKFRCTVAAQGYSIGDEVDIGNMDTTSRHWNTFADGTNISLSANTSIFIVTKTGGGSVSATVSSWDVVQWGIWF